jgi:hypothetical protein
MRTLTLADSLSRLGNKCIFIYRDHRGNLIEYIRNCGYITYELNMEPESVLTDSGTPKWLGGTQVQEAESTLKLINHLRPDWIIVAPMSSLNYPEEVHLAERLIEIHPWAGMARLPRSGDRVFGLIRECEDGRDVDALLKGPVCHGGFKRLN